MQEDFLAIFGHVAIDVTMRVDHFPTHGSVGVDKYQENYGGTAGNFALVASRLGYPFHVYSAVSGRTHAQYLKILSGRGVDTSHIVVDNSDYGPIGYAVSTGEEQIYYFYQGPMKDPLYERIEFGGAKYRYVHFGTGLPEDFIRIGKNLRGSKVVFDPGQEIGYRYDSENLRQMLEISEMAIMNEAESNTAAKILGTDPEELVSMCPSFIITKGKDGSQYFHRGDSMRFGSLAVRKPYDTIGAGDAFRAGIYFGLERRMDLPDSIIMGTIVASEAIKHPFVDFALSPETLIELFDQAKGGIRL